MSEDIKTKYDRLEHPAFGRKDPKPMTLEQEKEEWDFCMDQADHDTMLRREMARIRREWAPWKEKDVTVKNGVIYLELDGRRTNLNSLLLLGFYSVGRQLQRNSSPFREVQIIINYEMKATQQMVATASMESVMALSQGRINPEQFFNEVRY